MLYNKQFLLIYNKATIGFRNNKRTTFTKTNKPLKKFNIGYFDVVWLSVLKIKEKSKLIFLNKVFRVVSEDPKFEGCFLSQRIIDFIFKLNRTKCLVSC
jgi:hypothetical protein